ncbi:MAG: hypothetical protein K1X57_00925 [Gemmataceae bacterium]|nr:hypothetical protein [Gemmataceae bacterium]
MNDPIVDEVRRIHDVHAVRFNYDPDAICRDIKKQEKKSGLKFVSYGPRRTEPRRAPPAPGASTKLAGYSIVPEAIFPVEPKR